MEIMYLYYINLQISYRKNNPKLKKLKILFSWREHIEQQISFFFQNCGTGCINVVNNNKDFDIKPGDRIAQMVLTPVIKMNFEEIEELPETIRGEGGFGSTGK